ncbi:restriction endonuclease subunit S, partial [Halorubrum halophilum]|uniref:restriction endonuclease subunit S n=1 Tax=Halorubrum halophilum TaxID=413816 RepID=UPI0012AB98C9
KPLSNYIGRSAVVETEFDEPHYFASYLIRFRIPNIGDLPQWVNLVWNSPQIREKVLQKSSTSAGQYNLSQKKVLDFEIPLPPLEEQTKIISRIDELLSKLDFGFNELQNAQFRLEQYRRSVLHSAVSGETTKEWRESSNLEPASSTLQASNTHYNIPDTWVEAKLSNICNKITDGTHNSPDNYDSGDYMYITSKNLSGGELDTTDVTYVSEEDHKEIYSRCDPEEGDVLYIKDGVNTGIAVYNHIENEFSLLSSVALLKPGEQVDPHYLKYCLNSPVVRNQMVKQKGGVAIRRLTLSKINESTIPLPPIEEQRLIVERIDRKLSVVDNLRANTDDNLERADRLRMSIINKAIKGELISQKSVRHTSDEEIELSESESEKPGLQGQLTLSDITEDV